MAYRSVTGQKEKSKDRMSTETKDTGHLSKRPEAQHAEGKQRNTM
jgi:hypothetical protein